MYSVTPIAENFNSCWTFVNGVTDRPNLANQTFRQPTFFASGSEIREWKTGLNYFHNSQNENYANHKNSPFHEVSSLLPERGLCRFSWNILRRWERHFTMKKVVLYLLGLTLFYGYPLHCFDKFMASCQVAIDTQ